MKKSKYEDDIRKMNKESQRVDYMTFALVMLMAAGATIVTILALIAG